MEAQFLVMAIILQSIEILKRMLRDWQSPQGLVTAEATAGFFSLPLDFSLHGVPLDFSLHGVPLDFSLHGVPLDFSLHGLSFLSESLTVSDGGVNGTVFNRK